nr:hypothetical protein [Tanacetum cinerariifolium]
MNPVASQQVALDNALVALEKRLKIEKCNARAKFIKPQREETYQVTLDALKLSQCYPAFLIIAEVPEKKWFHSSRSSVTLESVICYQQSTQIKCTSPEEHLMLSSTGISPRSPQDLTGLGLQELKSCGECSTRRMLTMLLYCGKTLCFKLTTEK